MMRTGCDTWLLSMTLKPCEWSTKPRMESIRAHRDYKVIAGVLL